MYVDAKKVPAIEHFDLDAPLVKWLLHIRATAIEAEVEPCLVSNVIPWNFKLSESIIAAMIANDFLFLGIEEVLEQAFGEERCHEAEK